MRALLVLGLVGGLALAVAACGEEPAVTSTTEGMDPAQRVGALEAVVQLARARIAVDRAARGEALVAYDKALSSLPRGAGFPRVETFAQEVERERSAFASRAESPAAPVAVAEALVQYDVRDLVAAMGKLGFKQVGVAGPKGAPEKSPELLLGRLLDFLLPKQDAAFGEQPTELEAQEGVLVLHGSALRHAAMNIYLSTLRASWPALWPGILPVAAPETAPK